jgi:uncharacterized membrane protein YvlD (DUF360 family)
MTLGFLVYSLLLVVVWLWVVPAVTSDRVRIPENDFFAGFVKAVVVMIAFWLLESVLVSVLLSRAPRPVWISPYYSGQALDIGGWLLAMLVAGLAIWLLGLLRRPWLLYVRSYGWAFVAAVTVSISSHLISRFVMPVLMPLVYQLAAGPGVSHVPYWTWQ